MYRYALIILITAVSIWEVRAQQLVYKPVNPMFGGDTFNYQFLLQSAQSQNSFSDPDNF